MNKNEMNEIWRLIGTFRRNDPKARDKELLAAWYEVLRVYSFSDVKRAVVEHFRTSGFWPDVSELTARCPTYGAVTTERCGQRKKDTEAVHLLLVEEYHQRLRKVLTDFGVPDYDATGVSYVQWRKDAEAAGVRFDLVLEEAMEAVEKCVKD